MCKGCWRVAYSHELLSQPLTVSLACTRSMVPLLDASKRTSMGLLLTHVGDPSTDSAFYECRVGLALLKVSEEELVLLPFEQLLAALNSKQLPAFSRSPNSLLKLALSFRVSKRLNQFHLEHMKNVQPAATDDRPWA